MYQEMPKLPVSHPSLPLSLRLSVPLHTTARKTFSGNKEGGVAVPRNRFAWVGIPLYPNRKSSHNTEYLGSYFCCCQGQAPLCRTQFVEPVLITRVSKRDGKVPPPSPYHYILHYPSSNPTSHAPRCKSPWTGPLYLSISSQATRSKRSKRNHIGGEGERGAYVRLRRWPQESEAKAQCNQSPCRKSL